MRGEILTYDPQTGSGLVSGDDLQRYGFTSLTPDLAVGRRIDFIIDGREAREPVLLPHAPVARRVAPKPATSSAITPRDWRNRLFSLNGRMERAYFWTAILVMVLIQLAAFGLLALLPEADQLPRIVFVAALWPYLAVTTKRLHDIGRTGWLVAIPFGLITLVVQVATVIVIMGSVYGVLAISIDSGPSTRAFQTVAATAVGAGALVLLIQLTFVSLIGFWPGQTHDNRFGAPPGRTRPLRLEAGA
ncbi:DUF805 domain-containing protein [Brevundimonas sp.]|uniref:DUF805 domain-containing protein n=1 Tax=Brevundimonas sp. TaxID=1871086 RepID=UPI0037BF2BED